MHTVLNVPKFLLIQVLLQMVAFVCFLVIVVEWAAQNGHLGLRLYDGLASFLSGCA